MKNDRLISLNAALDEVESLVDTMSVCVSMEECKGMRSMKQRVLERLKALPPAQSGWIPVTERLPEESSPWRTGYLATVTCDTWAEPSVMYVQWETTTVRGKEVSRWIWNEKLFPKCWNLVAWMPLPKPWGGDTDAH